MSVDQMCGYGIVLPSASVLLEAYSRDEHDLVNGASGPRVPATEHYAVRWPSTAGPGIDSGSRWLSPVVVATPFATVVAGCPPIIS